MSVKKIVDGKIKYDVTGIIKYNECGFNDIFTRRNSNGIYGFSFICGTSKYGSCELIFRNISDDVCDVTCYCSMLFNESIKISIACDAMSDKYFDIFSAFVDMAIFKVNKYISHRVDQLGSVTSAISASN